MSTAVLETNSVSIQEDGPDLLRVNQYVLHGRLGEGAYGVVLECENEKKEHYAVKLLSKSLLRRQKEYTKVGRKMTITTALDDVKREIAVMKKLSHPRIVRLFEVVDDPDSDKLFMIMELVSGGEVMEWNKETKGFTANPRLRKADGTGHEMSEENARFVMLDVLSGLDYLHRSHIVHRDLKPQNLLLTNDPSRIRVKIADFGVAHMFESLNQNDGDSAASGEEKLTRVKGTYPFYAPECLEPESFDGYKADIWALGINLYCFLSGQLPFYDEIPPDLFEMIKLSDVDYRLLASRGCTSSAISFCRLLLEKDASRRWANAKTVLISQDPWLGDVGQDEETQLTLQKSISITDADIMAALTPATLNFATIASLKVMVAKWRKRANISAQKRREDEMRASFDSSAGQSPMHAIGIKKTPSTLSLHSEIGSPASGQAIQTLPQTQSFGSEAFLTESSSRSIKSMLSDREDLPPLPKPKSKNALRAGDIPPTGVASISEPAPESLSKPVSASSTIASATKAITVTSSNQSLVASSSVADARTSTSMPTSGAPATKRKSRVCIVS